MKIIITPIDIIERCLWYPYEYYFLTDLSLSEKDTLIKENKPFELSEKIAYTIGLLKIIHTDNILHKFNEHIENCITNRGFLEKASDKTFISSYSIHSHIDEFIKNFPSAYEPNKQWKSEIESAILYMNEIRDSINKLNKITFQDTECYNCSSILKLLKHHY